MTEPRHVLALDPGEKVGWARATVTPDGTWGDLHHDITPLKDMALALPERLVDYDVLIYETFRLFPHKAKTLLGSDLQTAQFVGMARLAAWQNPHVEVVSQGPIIKATANKTAPDWLRKIMDNEPSSHDDAHNVDALRHLWFWTWENYVIGK